MRILVPGKTASRSKRCVCNVLIQAMNIYVIAKWRYSSTSSSTLKLDGGKRSISRPDHFTAGETVSGMYWIGGWTCSKDGLDALEKGKVIYPDGIRSPIPRLSNP
jgi:hypothetical protein